MKNTKKLSAILLALVLVLTSFAGAFAADTGELKITGLNEGDNVELYKVADVDDYGVVTYVEKLGNSPFENELEPTAEEINILAQQLDKLDKIDNATKTLEEADKGEYTTSQNGGIYIAIITSANDKVVLYNPILLATSNVAGQMTNASVAANSNYTWSSVATAKSSAPKGSKEITATDGVQDKGINNDLTDDSITQPGNYAGWDEDEFTTENYGIGRNEGKKTVSIGDTINYEIRVQIPDYASTAINKSAWVTDTFDIGITSNDDVKLDGISHDESQNAQGYYEYKKTVDGKDLVIAYIKYKTDDSTLTETFELIFNYDNYKAANPNLDATLTYTGVLNQNAKIGRAPNLNTMEYNYTNRPNNGSTYEPGKERPTDDIVTIEDKEAVYTYKIALVKKDADSGKLLSGAKFVVKQGAKFLKQNETTKAWSLVDSQNDATVFESQANGLVELNGLEKGTYTFVEIQAPTGYQLTNVAVDVVANWDTAIYTNKGTTTWTTSKKDAKDYDADADTATRDGWIYNGAHLTDDQYIDLDETDKKNAKQAYVTEITGGSVELVTRPDFNNPAGIAIGEMGNTKTPSLPSTGGIGTYIFTIAGAAILAVAAFMLIFKKKGNAQH